MKLLYLLSCFIFFSFSLKAQDRYYYNGREKVEITPSQTSFISFKDTPSTVLNEFEEVKNIKNKNFTILDKRKAKFATKKSNKLVGEQVISAFHISSEMGAFKLYPTKTVRVKLKRDNNRDELNCILKNYQINNIVEKYGVLRIYIENIKNVFDISNEIYESGIADFSVPDFYTPLIKNQIEDPLFPIQYQMENTGQMISGFYGVSDIDSNASEAWGFTLGDDITVAVLDDGLENHEDLENRIIGGFTPANNGDGSPQSDSDVHGMNCAGIIAAADNNIGLRGVAPNANLLSINIFADGTTHGDIADGIQWAIENGADILSNSWSVDDVPCNYTSIEIENALQNAVTNGRDGNGSLVVFSAGNDGGCVGYPARNQNVISVGAVDNRGNLFDYSSRGSELDLVAPSGQTNFFGNVITLDRMDENGNNNGNYESSFGGTSAACPVVSGVAALVLSLNPHLTELEVRNILNNSATDMGVNGYDNNFGYGRVNAKAAIQETLNTLSIEGPNEICQGSSYEGVFTIPETLNNISTINWIIPNNLSYIRSGQGSEELHLSFFSPGSAIVKVDITLTNGEIIQLEKNVHSMYSNNNDNPTINIASNNPSNLTCCISSGYYNVEHATVSGGYSNNNDFEWKWKIMYQNPSDFYSFNNYDGTAYISVQKHTYSPLIVSVKMRTKNDCATSNWSNEISRYYGTVSNSISTRRSKLKVSNKSIPIDEAFVQKNKTLYVSFLDKYDWLNVNYSNVNLNEKEVDKVISILNNKTEKLNLEIFNLKGNSVFFRTFKQGDYQFNLSSFRRGTYIATFSLGELKYSCKYIIM